MIEVNNNNFTIINTNTKEDRSDDTVKKAIL